MHILSFPVRVTIAQCFSTMEVRTGGSSSHAMIFLSFSDYLTFTCIFVLTDSSIRDFQNHKRSGGFFYQQRPFFPECICACEALKFASLQAFCPSVLRPFPLRPFTPLRVTTWILNSHKAQAERFVLHLKRSFFI